MNKTLLIMAIVAVLAISVVSAAPVAVTGTVTDETSAIVEGANVSVDCNGNLQSDVTSAAGTYAVIYSEAECAPGDTVFVTAEKDGKSGSNSGVVELCTDLDSCPIDVALVDVQIPEFGVVAAGLALVGAVAGFAVMRRKN